MRALAWCGTTATLTELAYASGVCKPSTKPDSARKQARRLLERCIARGTLAQRHVRALFGECTHVSTPGTAGRRECERARRRAGLATGGCTAHHGHYVRTLPSGLTRAELVRRLDLPPAVVSERVDALKAQDRAKRRETGKASNDAEARAWTGLPTKRGPKGTNRVRRDRLANVPPIPPEGSDQIERSASLEGLRGDNAVAPTAPRPTSGEATPLTPEDAERRESMEGGRARVMPDATVVSIARARETRKVVDWFLASWAARGLPALNVLERRVVIWRRAQQLSVEELQLGMRRAERAARAKPERVFSRIFANRAVLAELIHEERRRLEESGARSGGGAVLAFPAPPAVRAAGPMTDEEHRQRAREQVSMLAELERQELERC